MDSTSRDDIARKPRPPALIVGREREQRLLGDLLGAAAAGGGRLVLLGGEAGIGKTVLVEALARDAYDRGVLVLTGGCYDLTTTPPYGPWIEAVAGDVPGDDRAPGPLDQHGEPRGQPTLFQEVGDYLAARSEQQPILLLLEDLHWADGASLDLLRFIARRSREQPLLLVVTYRDDEMPHQHPFYQMLLLIIREAHGIRIDLRQLDSSAVDQLVDARYGLAASEQRQLVAYLDELGGGNPLYIEELLRTLEAERRLRSTDGGWSLKDLGATHVPLLLRHMIDRRLSRLSITTRDALAVAAVVGQDVPVDLWSMLSGMTPDQLADIVEEALNTHVLEEMPSRTGLRFSHALIREAIYESMALPRRRVWHRRVAEALASASNTSPDEVAYHFQQAGDDRAIEWHVRAGLRARNSAWFSAAHHFETAALLLEGSEGREYERGWLNFEAGFLLRFSGDIRAIELLETAEASARITDDPILATFVRYLLGSQRCMFGDIRRGLVDIRHGVAAIDTLLESQHVPNTQTQALAVIRRLLPANESELYDLPTAQTQDVRGVPQVNQQRGVLIDWLALTGRYQEAIAVGEAFLEEIDTRLDDEYLRRAASLMCQLGLGHAYAGTGRPEEARHALALAYSTGISLGSNEMAEHAIWADLSMAVIPYDTDRIVERERLVTMALEAWNRSRGLTIAAAGDGVPSELQLHLLEGRWKQVYQMALDFLLAPWSVLVHEAIVTLGILAREQGHPSRSWERVLELLPQGPLTDPGDSYFPSAITAVALAAELALDERDLTMAQRWIEMHGRWLDWSEATLWQADTQLLRARFHECSGDLARTRHHADRALTLASEPRQPLRLVAAHRMLGSLDRQEGRHDRAAAHLAESVTLAEACAAPFERALSLLALAELRSATGECDAARSLLDEVQMICTPIDARPTLERVAALQARIGAGQPSPGGLTVREVEVLRLIAAGHSNRRIAETLFLSPRTIERHIANIYLKIDAHSKVEATSYAQRHNLT